jgi:hypothetical protein
MEIILLRSVNLFKGPLSDLVIKVLVALIGLNRPAMSGADRDIMLLCIICTGRGLFHAMSS